MKTKIILLLIAIVLALILWFGFKDVPVSQPFDQNDQNNVVAEESPIYVTNIKDGDKIESPLLVKGTAKGTWFFEASFPIKIVDSKGNIVAQGIAQAQEDWMTENYVPFISALNFEKPTDTEGKLILSKDNPSGLPENDDQIEIKIKF